MTAFNGGQVSGSESKRPAAGTLIKLHACLMAGRVLLRHTQRNEEAPITYVRVAMS